MNEYRDCAYKLETLIKEQIENIVLGIPTHIFLYFMYCSACFRGHVINHSLARRIGKTQKTNIMRYNYFFKRKLLLIACRDFFVIKLVHTR